MKFSSAKILLNSLQLIITFFTIDIIQQNDEFLKKHERVGVPRKMKRFYGSIFLGILGFAVIGLGEVSEIYISKNF